MDREKIDYTIAVSQIQELAKIDAHYMPLLANVSALLNDMLSDVNWVGFYIMKNDQLVLGPFQGKPACVHIKPGEGVCGTAVQNKKTIRVDDVHQFPGHIACDTASRSELVIPMFNRYTDVNACEMPPEFAVRNIIGVLDIDSPTVGRFTQEDQDALEKIVRALESVVVKFDRKRDNKN